MTGIGAGEIAMVASNAGADKIAGETRDALDAIRDGLWRELTDGARDRRHPFHTGVIATVDAAGAPQARVVVLRATDVAARTLTFHTDVRSPKLSEIRLSSRIAWVFYDPGAAVQLRLSGTADVRVTGEPGSGDAEAATAWNRASLWARRCYLSIAAPGTPSEGPTSGLPEPLASRAPTAEESDLEGRRNFARVATTITRIDWLHLAHTGHRRARFQWMEQAWHATWLVP